MAFWKSEHAHPVRSHEFKVEWVGGLSHTVKSCTKPSVEVNGSEYQLGNQIFKHPGVAKWNDITLTFVDDKTTTRKIFQQLIDQGLLIPSGEKRFGGMSLPSGSADTGGGFGTSAEEKAVQKRKELFEEINENRKLRGKKALQFREEYPDPKFEQHTDDSMKKGKIGNIIISQHTVMTRRDVTPDTPGTIFRAPKKGGVKQITSSSTPKILEKWTLKNAWIKSINFGTLDYSSDELITIEVIISYDWCEVDFPRLNPMYS